jgi:hypothetical protein
MHGECPRAWTIQRCRCSSPAKRTGRTGAFVGRTNAPDWIPAPPWRLDWSGTVPRGHVDLNEFAPGAPGPGRSWMDRCRRAASSCGLARTLKSSRKRNRFLLRERDERTLTGER